MPRWTSLPKVLPGDWLIMGLSVALVLVLFATLWQPQHAARLQIRDHNGIYATFSLAQDRDIDVPGPLGLSHIVIHQGRVRFTASPCRNQYCVHQHWLSHVGEVAVCLPNQVSVELLGGEKVYDSLNY